MLNHIKNSGGGDMAEWFYAQNVEFELTKKKSTYLNFDVYEVLIRLRYCYEY